MRSHVSVFGTFQCDRPSAPWVEVLINYLGEIASETADLYEILNACTQNPLQATELFQKLASLDGPQARNGFKYRLAMTLGPFAPVSRDRETVRFVAHALNQV
jgi:hypothetical protein